MARYLTDLADVLRKAGLDVVEMPGWKTRGRPGAFDPKGVLCHHTAGAGDGYNDAWGMATNGRADLNPPLAQLALSRKGTWYVLAAGRANHAGRCKAIGGLQPYPGESYGDGNAQLLGIEAQNRGTDAEDWSPTQYRSYVRGVAALTKHYGWRIVFGHKETSTSGKVDPDFSMDKFRRDVAAVDPTEDEVTPQDIKDIANAVLGAKVIPANMLVPARKDGDPDFLVDIPRSLDLVMRWALEGRDNAIVARKVSEAQALKGDALTPDEVKAAVKAALSEAAQIEVVVKKAEA